MSFNFLGHWELEWFLRIIVSALIGGFIGYERHNRSKEAGIRTHAIVCLAAALAMIVSKYGFADVGSSDPGRIAAQVVSGIGFLGAGIIFVKNDTVLGLTTAAGVWATAAVGLCLGSGYYVIGILSGILIVIVQIIVRNIFDFSSPRTSMQFCISICDENIEAFSHISKDISVCFRSLGFIQPESHITGGDSENVWNITTEVITAKDIDPTTVVTELKKIPGVVKVVLL